MIDIIKSGWLIREYIVSNLIPVISINTNTDGPIIKFFLELFASHKIMLIVINFVLSSFPFTCSIPSRVGVITCTGYAFLHGILIAIFWCSTIASRWWVHTVDLLLLWDMECVHIIGFIWKYEKVALNDSAGSKCPARSTESLISHWSDISFIIPIGRVVFLFLESSPPSLILFPVMLSMIFFCSKIEPSTEIHHIEFPLCKIRELSDCEFIVP